MDLASRQRDTTNILLFTIICILLWNYRQWMLSAIMPLAKENTEAATDNEKESRRRASKPIAFTERNQATG